MAEETAGCGVNGAERGYGPRPDLKGIQQRLIPFPSPELADLIDHNMDSLRREILAGIERGIPEELSRKIGGGEERVALFLSALSAALRSGDPEPFLSYQADEVEGYARNGASLAEVEALVDCIREGLMRALLESASTPDQTLSLSLGSRILEKFIDATSAMTARYFILARERELKEKEEQLERLAQRLLVAQEEERKRIGQDIHDELIQLLFGLRYQTDVVIRKLERGECVEGDLQAIKGRIDHGLAELRRILRNLRPAVLDDLGLVQALNLLARQLGETAGLPANIMIEEGIGRLAPEMETCLYRVAQESLVNTVKHAGASRVEISLCMEGGAVVLKVRDDGRGLEGGDALAVEGPAYLAGSDERRSGGTAYSGNSHDGMSWGAGRLSGNADRMGGSFGLYGMRERLRALGGRLSVKSVPGEGTTVTAEIPV